MIEDIIFFMKDNPQIELDEDIEYTMERFDSRANQRFIRFFQISCKDLGSVTLDQYT